MKKVSLILCTVMALAASTNLSAQEFYIRGGGGYSLESGGTEFNNADPNGLTMIQQSTDITVNPDGSARVKSLNGTLGSGFKGNVTFGYMFNPYIGAELGFNYFSGDEKTIGKLNSPLMQSEAKAYLEGLDIMPAIYLTPAFSKLNPYARIGLLIPAAGKLHIDSQAYAPNGGGEGVDVGVRARTEVESRFSVGFAGALGVTYPIGPKLHVFGEVEFKNLSIKSKSAEIKEYETTAYTPSGNVLVPGQQLADLPTNETHFQFEDEYTEGAPNANEPRKIPTQYVNASGIGFNIGVRYSFGK
ncbi:outer membrane beta-barrel protein [Flavobacterium qiangtangense]|uniref:Outer membrane beta-barrel protein n=1 Tax=Flavobacterium qiangtangense TaxID=1442595 RepID=A0ABW1PMP0_9FLAO